MKYIKASVLVFILASCSPRVISYTNSNANFQSYESYQLVNAKISRRQLPPQATKLLGSIERNIREEMESKRGYTPSSIGPDLTLRYELVSSSRTEVNNNTGPGFAAPTFNSRTLYESVILIELLENNKLVWQGSFDMNQSRRDERNENTIKKAIGLIFTTYPYKAGQRLPDESLTNKKKK